MPWPVLQMHRPWAPQCLAGFPGAHVRLQGTDVLATFPGAVGKASPFHLPGPEPLYVFLFQRLGFRNCTVLGLGLLTAPQPGVAVPRCRAKIKGRAEGLRGCVFACPAWSVRLCLVGVCGAPKQPWFACDQPAPLAGEHASCCLVLRVCISVPLASLCVCLHGLSCSPSLPVPRA